MVGIRRRQAGDVPTVCIICGKWKRALLVAIGLIIIALTHVMMSWSNLSETVETDGANTKDMNQQQQDPQQDPHRTDEHLIAVVVGLPKAGTTSLYNLFHCSEYHTSHYCCCGSNKTEYPCSDLHNEASHMPFQMSEKMRQNLASGQPILSGVGDGIEVHAQMDGETMDGGYFLPQYYHLEALHQAAPNAIWILNHRDPQGWASSVLGWLDMGRRIRREYKRHAADSNSTDRLSLNDFLLWFHQSHLQTVRSFVRDHRTHVLIDVDITHDDIVEQITKHVQVNRPCWKKHNSGPFFQSAKFD